MRGHIAGKLVVTESGAVLFSTGCPWAWPGDLLQSAVALWHPGPLTWESLGGTHTAALNVHSYRQPRMRAIFRESGELYHGLSFEWLWKTSFRPLYCFKAWILSLGVWLLLITVLVDTYESTKKIVLQLSFGKLLSELAIKTLVLTFFYSLT
jgi:hypothetical protein